MLIPSTGVCTGFPNRVYNSEKLWWNLTSFPLNVGTVHGVTIKNLTTMCGSHDCDDPVVVSSAERPDEVVTFQPVLVQVDCCALVVFNPLVQYWVNKVHIWVD